MPDKDANPIVDPEVEWKASNPTWLAEEVRKAQAKKKTKTPTDQEDDVDFIIDTVDDSKLRDRMQENNDFVAFDETDSEDDVQRQLGGVGRLVFDTNTETMAWIL